MFFLLVVFLGIVEGLTEFLPVSSTAHLLIFNHLLNFSGDYANSFTVIIQLGAVLAVLVVYWQLFITKAKEIPTSKESRKFWVNILIGIIPAVILGLLLKKIILGVFFENPWIFSIALIVGGILLFTAENFGMKQRRQVKSVEKMSYLQALIVGLFQCLALIPGMSRSGSTIVGGLYSGLDRKTSAEFSFFAAIPLMLGATVLSLKDVVIKGAQEWIGLIIGFIVAFIVARIVLKAFLKFVTTHTLKGFGVYRIILGILLIILILLGVLKA